MSWVGLRPLQQLAKAIAQTGAMTVHVDDLHLTDDKTLRGALVEDVELEFAKAEIQLSMQRLMGVLLRLRGVVVDQT